jgi:hypothetical protein
MYHTNSIVYSDEHDIFLEDSSELTELDGWVQECIKSRKRFTFSEREVLQSLWDKGEDIRLREDSRFCEVMLPSQAQEVQWRLKRQIITNQHLYELLEDEEWDGKDLYQYLEHFDQSISEDAFHIFFLHDHRFIISYDDQGFYHISLRADRKKIILTPEQKNSADQLASQLLALFPDNTRTPWSTHVLLEHLKQLSATADMWEEVLPVAIENWLLQREEWVRVGRDSWFPQALIPSLGKSHQYAVLPVLSPVEGRSFSFPSISYESPIAQEISQSVDETSRQQDQLIVSTVKWKMTLRTLHINEGYIPIPTKARIFYPRAKKLSSLVAVAGVWFADASEMTIWLDTEKHQLYGPDIQDQLAFLVAGTMLEMLWTSSGMSFNTIGVDATVAEEEARLVDLTALAHSRSALLESYRDSLRAIMASSNTGWSFSELYNELCSRQQHKPNRSTIRTVLSSSPEFTFVRAENKWIVNPDISPEDGTKIVRRAKAIAHYNIVESDIKQQECLSLAEMIAKSRERLGYLRSLYTHIS